jgi:hypothetical protein
VFRANLRPCNFFYYISPNTKYVVNLIIFSNFGINTDQSQHLLIQVLKPDIKIRYFYLKFSDTVNI